METKKTSTKSMTLAEANVDVLLQTLQDRLKSDNFVIARMAEGSLSTIKLTNPTVREMIFTMLTIGNLDDYIVSDPNLEDADIVSVEISASVDGVMDMDIDYDDDYFDDDDDECCSGCCATDCTCDCDDEPKQADKNEHPANMADIFSMIFGGPIVCPRSDACENVECPAHSKAQSNVDKTADEKVDNKETGDEKSE